MTVGTRAQVFHGTESETSGGLKKSDLKKCKKTGEIVSKEKSKLGKKNQWAQATKKAYSEMERSGLIKKSDGLIKMNIGVKGKQLYDLSRMYYDQMSK
jgi:hypothetical protein